MQQAQGHGIKLYKYVTAGQAGKWELATSNARPSFYDALEDTSASGSKSDWFLEVGYSPGPPLPARERRHECGLCIAQVDGADIDVHIDQAAGLIMDTAQRRVTFNAGGLVWAMRFPNDATFKWVWMLCFWFICCGWSWAVGLFAAL